MTTVMPPPGSRSTPDAMAAAGCTERQVNHWCRLGLLGEAFTSGPGYGRRREFSDEDVDVMRVLVRLMALRAPVAVDWPHRAVAHVREHGPTGTFELVPGVIVDVARLVDA